MTTPRDGGPAFPRAIEIPGAVTDGPGMSLRDWFAGMILGATDWNDLSFGTQNQPYDPWPWQATQAYRAADAMLAAREREVDRG